MSTTATTPDLDKTPADRYVARSPLSALLATLTALVATVLALFDLFANGLWPTCMHLAVGLAVFGAVRLCVGLALDPFFPTDDPEST
ncbi:MULTISPECIES: hypothetical protein [Streptomyces violaceusniger group]|uniref:Integral membrane protein n=2 Tax=Streptomyces rhizosphaericus TaxID=114699 RepID=A0ABN1NZL9_9ACTN|nr:MULTISPECIES: hypothetical protein [Streptomyces violaceusniger group]